MKVEFDTIEDIGNFVRLICPLSVQLIEQNVMVEQIKDLGYLKKTRLEKAKEAFKELMDAYEEELQQKNLLLERLDNV